MRDRLTDWVAICMALIAFPAMVFYIRGEAVVENKYNYWLFITASVLLILGGIQGTKWANAKEVHGMGRVSYLIQGVVIGSLPLWGIGLPLVIAVVYDNYLQEGNTASLLGCAVLVLILLFCITFMILGSRNLPKKPPSVPFMSSKKKKDRYPGVGVRNFDPR